MESLLLKDDNTVVTTYQDEEYGEVEEIASTLKYRPPRTETTPRPVPELQEGDGEDGRVSQLQSETSPPSGTHYGIQSINELSGLLRSVAEKKLGNGTDVITNGVDILNGVVTESTSVISHFVGRVVSDDNPNLQKESIQEVPEWDIEKVLDQQETHDLYCPKCNSCITKRVILKKRKRITPDPHYTSGEKIEVVQSSSLVINNQALDAYTSALGGRTIPAERTDQDRIDEPEVFTCLSCFSFFIPSASSFNPFWIFGFKGKSASVQKLQQSQGEVAASLVTPTPNESDLVPLVTPASRESLIQPVKSAAPVPKKDGKDFVVFSSSSSSVTHEVVKDEIGGTTHRTTLSNTEGRDVIVSIPESEDSRQLDKSAVSNKWDILKSIVYGGLLESITSLAVVSSAAGGDTATLNIVALGLANLVGGLFVILHELMDLKNEPYGSATDQNGTVGRYQKILGNRSNFSVHAIVAVLSYMLFGLVAPITYGFAFRESDNKDYKLIAVAAAALLCITLLAILKAYVQKPPKAYIKTTFRFLCIGVMSSGLPYVAGMLAKKILTDHGLFASTVVDPESPPSALLESMVLNSSWTS